MSFFQNVVDAGAIGSDFFKIVRGIDYAVMHHLEGGGQFDRPGTAKCVAHVALEAAYGDFRAEDGCYRPGFGGITLLGSGGMGVDVTDLACGHPCRFQRGVHASDH